VQPEKEVLVKWKNIPECENSWEFMSKMKEAFPDFHILRTR